MSDAADDRQPPAPPHLCDYAADVTADRLDRMLSHIDGVRKAEALEPVHQMRVWSRRSRAALEIFRVCFQGREFSEVEREVKATTDALSEARDLDVMIENLEARAAKLSASQRVGIDSFVVRLRAKREAGQAAVAGTVTELESHNLAQRFRDLAHKASQETTSVAGVDDRPKAGKGRRHGRKRGGGRG